VSADIAVTPGPLDGVPDAAADADADGDGDGDGGLPGLRRLPHRLRFRDVVSVGTVGMRAKRTRTTLTALGIAIGIAAMVAVVGISASSRSDLLAELDRLGTNHLQAAAGSDVFGDPSELPVSSAAAIRRIDGVLSASATRTVEGATVRRSDHIPEESTGGMSVVATEPNLDDTLGMTMDAGAFLNEATATQPGVVLGARAAERLGIVSLAGDPMVFVGGHWFTVVGILDEMPLAPDLDRSVLIGYAVAQELFDIDESASNVRVRTNPEATEDVADVLAATANPEAPDEVDVTQPSDALEARAQVDESLTALLLGLGGVALVVGGVGIANVMVISVLERRAEIGIRRALGATRRHIRIQFLVESMLLAGLGGAAGVAIGAAITSVYANSRDWSFTVPALGLVGGIAVSVVVGALAGLYPAVRASRLAPAEAVRSE